MKKPKNGYQKGDVVEWGGVKGFVVTLEGANPHAPLQVMFPTARDAKGLIPVVGFTAHGGFLTWHTEPVLNWVRRPGESFFDKLAQAYPRIVSLFKKQPLTLTVHPTSSTQGPPDETI